MKRTLKILSYNIHSGHDFEGKKNLSDIGDFIKQVGADIVGLNEVDCKNERCGFVDQAEYLRERAGYDYCAFSPSIEFRGGYYGNAMLSKYPILEAEPIAIPAAPDADKHHEPRSILRCIIDAPCGKLTVMVTHYGVHAVSERVEGVKKTIELVEAAGDMPIVFMGDLNATPDAEELQPLLTVLKDTAKGFTESTLNSIAFPYPTKRIDFIFAKGHSGVENVFVPNVPYSDHCPYIADISFGTAW